MNSLTEVENTKFSPVEKGYISPNQSPMLEVKCQITYTFKQSILKYIFLIVIFEEVFSDYFEPSNVL